MSGPEFLPVRYTEREDCKYFEKITHKFKFKSEDVKYDMPVYDDEHPELFIKLVNKYWNMAETYELFTGDKKTSVRPLQKMSEGISKSRLVYNRKRHNTGQSNSTDFIKIITCRNSRRRCRRQPGRQHGTENQAKRS